MKVLVACEESQEVCKAFRAKGHEAYSCDLIEPSGGHSEEWKQIPNFPQYEASSLGRIKSVERTICYKNGRLVHIKQRILKPTKSSGYYSVNLSVKNKSKSVKVHVLIALAFIGQNQNGYDVRHKNGNKSDNRSENLEYGTRSENMMDGYRIRGYVTKNQKLSPEKAVEIIKKNKDGVSQRRLAEQYNVSKSAIAAILTGENYKWYTAIAK